MVQRGLRNTERTHNAFVALTLADRRMTPQRQLDQNIIDSQQTLLVLGACCIQGT